MFEYVVKREESLWQEMEELNWLDSKSINRILKLIPRPKGKCLELCIGSGMFTKYMNFQEVTKYTGIDISGTLLKKTKGILPFVETRKSNVMNLEEYPENTFDYLSVFAGLHHIPDISATINESYRVLKKGGIFVAFEPNLDAFYGWLLLKIGKKLKMYTMDETFLKSSSICKHLEKTGFKNIKVHFITPRYDFKNLRNKKKYRIAYSIMKLFSFFPGKYTNSFFVITTYK